MAVPKSLPSGFKREGEAEHLAAPASGAREQPDRGGGLGSPAPAPVEHAPDRLQLVLTEASGGVIAGVFLPMPRQKLVPRARANPTPRHGTA